MFGSFPILKLLVPSQRSQWGGIVLVALLWLPPVALAAEAAAKPTAKSEAVAGDDAALERLAAGELPEGVTLAQLFSFDLLIEPEVQAEKLRVEQLLLALPATAEGAEISPERRQLQLRLKILSAAPEFRKSLVEAEQRRNAAELEREQAETARLKAEAEAAAAEIARQQALEAAEAALSAAERLYATELARAESVRRDQAKFRQRLAELRVALRTQTAEAADEQLRIRVQQAEAESADNRILYEECVIQVSAARSALHVALNAITAPLDVPDFQLPQKLPEEAELSEQRTALLKAAQEIRADVAVLTEEQRRQRHDQAAVAYERQQRLNAVRLQLLEKLAPEDQQEILGLGPVGLGQLQREIEHLQLEFAWYRYARANLGFVWASTTEDSNQLIRGVWDLLRFVILCLFAVYVLRKGSGWLDQLGTQIARWLQDGVYRGWALEALDLVDHLLAELLLVTVALLAPVAIGSVADIPEVTLLLKLFLFFALYRLLIAVLYRSIAWLSVGRAGLSPRLRALTLRSLRLSGIYLLVTAVILTLSAEFLGRGYLYHVVANIWWIGGLPIAFVLVRWWQPDIVEGFLAFRSTGNMAQAVRATREKWYGFFVAVIAVAVLIAVGAASLAGRFVMGFDQTRRALAYLFRRRLEKHAEVQAGPETPTTLPEELVAALSESPIDHPALLLDHLPGLDDFVAETEAWAAGGPLVPSLLVGDTGFGKTTWLRSAAARLTKAGLKVRLLEPPPEVTGGEGLLPWLCRELETTSSTWQELGQALAGREREVIMVDDGQMLFTRRMNGFEAWDGLSSCAGASASPVLWMVAVARFPFDYLQWARGSTAPFRHVYRIKPWSDTQIAQLLSTRMKAAGFKVRYDDLVIDRVEGVRRQSQLLRTETEYARLIWDYSEGCPRTALRCWRASLRLVAKKTVSVRLFRRPPLERLDKLGRQERFILAALVWHQALTPALAHEVLRFPLGICADTLALLREWKVATETGGVYRLESDWLQPVRRLLHREHLVVM